MRDEKEKLEEMEMKLTVEKERQAKEKKELVARKEEMGRRLEPNKNKEMETRLEATDKEMESRLEKFEDKMKRDKAEDRGEQIFFKKRNCFQQCSEEAISSRPSNCSHLCLAGWPISSPQTVTFESFANNQDRPGGGSGELDLDPATLSPSLPLVK